jgi:hypothetical protein
MLWETAIGWMCMLDGPRLLEIGRDGEMKTNMENKQEGGKKKDWAVKLVMRAARQAAEGDGLRLESLRT